MFTYNSYLLLGTLAQQGVNMPFLINNGYELSKCDYSFNRDIDQKGEVVSRSMGALFDISINRIPTNELIKWAISHREYKDGAIIFCNSEGQVLEKIYFYNAACIAFNINYIQTGKSYTSCDLMLSARNLKIGNIEYNSEWVNR